MKILLVIFLFPVMSLCAQEYNSAVMTDKAVIYTLRLDKGDDIKRSLEQFAAKHTIPSGSLLTCVGSVQNLAVRYAMKNTIDTIRGPLEIVSVTGTIASSGVHVHMAAGDNNGNVQGGHLEYGTHVMMTAEIIIMVYPSIVFKRQIDEKTGFPVLQIQKNE